MNGTQGHFSTIKEYLPVVQLVGHISTVAFLGLSVWLATKLAPFAETDAIIITRLEAYEASNPVPRSEYEATLKSIDERLGRIEVHLLNR